MALLIPGLVSFSRITTTAVALAAVAPGCIFSDPPCGPGDLSVHLFHQAGAVEEVLYTGAAMVTAHDPGVDSSSLSLLYDTGEAIDFNYRIGAHELPVSVGDQVEAYVDLEMPFWTETTLVLHEPGPTGAFLAAVWDTSGMLPPGEQTGFVTVSYVDAGCSAVNDGCGDRVSLAMAVPLGEEEPAIRVDAGTEVVDGTWRMGNGNSSGRFLGQIQCTDTPQDWTAGFILVE